MVLDMGFPVVLELFLGHPQANKALPLCPEISPNHHLKTTFREPRPHYWAH